MPHKSGKKVKGPQYEQAVKVEVKKKKGKGRGK